MSGGFFRGTSADQDTRFSNKQAKLLKSQKFAPELDHLVDTRKVKMDVIRPWIATRSTELLGFEDEVLINFVYGLLDGKEVDGKQIQIQLTGFMEKNTRKFMKELWGLLLSAQKNASGVPQQFLDAKEQETLRRKVENDRITQEILKRREEGKEAEQEKPRRMDGELHNPRSSEVVPTSGTRHSSSHLDEERKMDRAHGSRAKNRYSGSSSSDDRSTLHREVHKSRSISVSPHSRMQSVSPKRHSRSPSRWFRSFDRRYRSPRHSISPRRHSPRNDQSHVWRRSARARRMSPSISRHRSPCPIRRQSPYARRKSPSYLRRRSPSPMRRRPPSHASRRPHSPAPHRSPIRQRSLSSASRGSLSPTRDMSPSLAQCRSPTLARRRFPSSPRRSPQPVSAKPRRSPMPSPRTHAANSSIFPREGRSRSPYKSWSPIRPSHRSFSGELNRRTNDDHYSRDGSMSQKSHERRLYAYHTDDHTAEKRKASDSITQKIPTTVRSPQHDEKDICNRKHALPLDPNPSASPTFLKKNPGDNSKQINFVRQPSQSPEEREHGSRRRKEGSHSRDDAYGRNQSVDVKKQSYSKELEYEKESTRKTVDSDSDESEILKDHGMEKGWRKKSNKHKRHLDDISGSDSESDDKETKRRKELKRLRKEEKQHRREERHRRKLERHASKQKVKSVDTVTPPSDLDKNYHTNESDGEDVIRKCSSTNDAEQTKTAHKRLEYELREKALESLGAKKSSHYIPLPTVPSL